MRASTVAVVLTVTLALGLAMVLVVVPALCYGRSPLPVRLTGAEAPDAEWAEAARVVGGWFGEKAACTSDQSGSGYCGLHSLLSSRTGSGNEVGVQATARWRPRLSREDWYLNTKPYLYSSGRTVVLGVVTVRRETGPNAKGPWVLAPWSEGGDGGANEINTFRTFHVDAPSTVVNQSVISSRTREQRKAAIAFNIGGLIENAARARPYPHYNNLPLMAQLLPPMTAEANSRVLRSWIWHLDVETGVDPARGTGWYLTGYLWAQHPDDTGRGPGRFYLYRHPEAGIVGARVPPATPGSDGVDATGRSPTAATVNKTLVGIMRPPDDPAGGVYLYFPRNGAGVRHRTPGQTAVPTGTEFIRVGTNDERGLDDPRHVVNLPLVAGARPQRWVFEVPPIFCVPGDRHDTQRNVIGTKNLRAGVCDPHPFDALVGAGAGRRHRTLTKAAPDRNWEGHFKSRVDHYRKAATDCGPDDEDCKTNEEGHAKSFEDALTLAKTAAEAMGHTIFDPSCFNLTGGHTVVATPESRCGFDMDNPALTDESIHCRVEAMKKGGEGVAYSQLKDDAEWQEKSAHYRACVS